MYIRFICLRYIFIFIFYGICGVTVWLIIYFYSLDESVVQVCIKFIYLRCVFIFIFYGSIIVLVTLNFFFS
jgi:hypothetical protein